MASMFRGLAATTVSGLGWSFINKAAVLLAGAGVVNDAGCVRLPASEAKEKPRQGDSPANGVEGRLPEPSPCCSSIPDSVGVIGLWFTLTVLGSLPNVKMEEARAANERLS